MFPIKRLYFNDFTCIVHGPKFKAEFRSMERSVDRMKLHREKYSEDFIPYNLPALFQRCKKLGNLTGQELASSSTHIRCANHCASQALME
jgi:hypothetical protein